MPRLWIVLLVIWYRAFTLAKSEHANPNTDEHLAFLFDSQDQDSANSAIRNRRSYKIQEDPPLNADGPKTNEGASFSATGSPDINEKIKTNPDEGRLNELMMTKLDDTLTPYNPVDWYAEQCLNGVSKRKFNSWGGKRAQYYANGYDDQHLLDCINFLAQSMEYLGESDDSKLTNDLNKIDSYNRNKMSFHSWGGKRSAEDQLAPKRLPFRAWGGKRENTKESLTPKRLPFNAWGGKRSPEKFAYPMYPTYDEPRIDREAMLSLTESFPEPNTKRVNRKKTKFHSWGGKRSYDDARIAQSIDLDPLEELLLKDINGVGRRRLKFNSWGGKRNDQSDSDDPEEKRTFHSWGGKRQVDDLSWDDYPSYDTNKRTFHSWGGK